MKIGFQYYTAMEQTKKCRACEEVHHLYQCTFKNCSKKDKLYCDGCYKSLHDRGKCKHEFNLKYMQEIDASKYNPNKSQKIGIINNFKNIYTKNKASVVGSVTQQACYIGFEQLQISTQVLYKIPFLTPENSLIVSNIGVICASVGIGFGALAVFGALTAMDFRKYWKGQITLKELGRKVARNFCTTIGLSAATTIGVSASLGTNALMLLAFGAPFIGVGITVGIGVAIALGVIFVWGIKKGFDYFFPSDVCGYIILSEYALIV